MAVVGQKGTLEISVTEKAAERIKHFADKEGKGTAFGLRVGVKGGGCSGLLYTLGVVDDDPTDTDRVVEDRGVRIFIDKKSYIYLAGTELDFSDGLNGKGFVFQNPNAKKACGCGTSFAV